MKSTIERQKGRFFWMFDKRVFDDISEQHFCHDYWHKKGAVVGTETGRGTTLFLQHNSHQLVLRHYLRGGLVSKINKDRYWFKNWNACRSSAEFEILEQLRRKELPVPKPVAAQIRRYRTRYQADIIIERIPQARDLLSVLKDAPQSPKFYTKLAKVIADFHKEGVYHADLNIQNILYDANGQFWLIDFDRAKVLSPQQKWQLKNIKRLKRSFEKEKGRHHIQWNPEEWELFEAAYLLAMSGGEAHEEAME